MKLLIMHCPLLCHFVPLRPKYLSEHSVIKGPQLVFLLSVRGVQQNEGKYPFTCPYYLLSSLHDVGKLTIKLVVET